MKKIHFLFSYEYIFLIAGTILGLSLVFINPPFQSNDEDRHFFNAYSLARGHWGPVIKDRKPGSLITASSRDIVQVFQIIKYDQNDRLSKERLNEIKDREDDGNEVFYHHTSATNNSFPYIPAAIGIKAGTIFTIDPVSLGWWGRIGSLAAYLTILFFSIRIIPYFKALLTVCALTPMAIYQGASITYDTLGIALLLMLFSYTLHLYFQEEKINWKQLAFFCLIALGQKLSKDGYFVLYFTLFAISIRRFEKTHLYLATIAGLILISILPSFLWNKYLYGLGLTNADIQFRSDYLFDTAFHLKYHLKDPLNLINLMIQNIFFEGKLWIIGSIARYGFSYATMAEWFYFFQLVMLFTIVAIDQADRLISFRFRISYIIFALAGTGATITGFYLYLSPIGAETLFNFQGRYLTPCIPFLFFGLFYVPHRKFDPRIIKWLVLGYAIFTTIFMIDFIGDRYYVI